MSEGRPWWAFGCSRDLTERDLANVRRLNVWMFVLVVTWLGALFVLDADGLTSPAAVAVVLVPVAAGARMFRVAVTFIREADELTRKIQVQSLAVGFGAGFAAALLERLAEESVELLSGAGWIAAIPDLFAPLLWMAVAYSISVTRLQHSYNR